MSYQSNKLEWAIPKNIKHLNLYNSNKGWNAVLLTETCSKKQTLHTPPHWSNWWSAIASSKGDRWALCGHTAWPMPQGNGLAKRRVDWISWDRVERFHQAWQWCTWSSDSPSWWFSLSKLKKRWKINVVWTWFSWGDLQSIMRNCQEGILAKLNQASSLALLTENLWKWKPHISLMVHRGPAF